jgi:hypothetical protein
MRVTLPLLLRDALKLLHFRARAQKKICGKVFGNPWHGDKAYLRKKTYTSLLFRSGRLDLPSWRKVSSGDPKCGLDAPGAGAVRFLPLRLEPRHRDNMFEHS